jgi:phage N-6-adenine-methyltransferase
MLNESLFSSEKDDWETPEELFKQLNDEFNFTLDPCCTRETAKCFNFYTAEDNGLTKEWKGSVFMNPPYGRQIVNWVKKAKEESEKGSVVVCLVPARTDTKWWHAYCMKSSEIRLLTKRLTFKGASNKATFPAAIVVFRRGECVPTLKAQLI